MAARQSDENGSSDGTVAVRRRDRWRRGAAIAFLAILALFLVLIVAVWIARRPIATEVLQRQFEQRGVRATYQLERVGLRTQVVRNLVIGDPRNPDLIARYALIQVRWTLAGSVSVYRIVARGVRLRGRVEEGKVVWGEVSKLLPPPTDKPFALPNMVLDVADSSIGLETPFGNLGFALTGTGNLTGGFKGHVAAVSPRLDMGRCSLDGMRAYTAIRVTARRPRVDGPFVANRFVCPASNLLMDAPHFELNSTFSESFTSFDGSARVTTQRVIAGANGLAAMTGNVRFTGTPKAAYGRIDVAAQRSRLGPIYAERTHIDGRYLIGAAAGTLSLVGIVEAQRNAGWWYVVPQLVAFFIYMVAGVAETNRNPFDLPEAESELVAGFHTEYSGMRFALFFLGEYANMIVISAVATTLFLGGWLRPFPSVAALAFLDFVPGPIWFFLKMSIFLFAYIWFRGTFPRYRFDQLMDLGWKWMIPLALANIFLTGLIKLLV